MQSHKLFTVALIAAAVISAAYVAASLIRVPRTAITAERPSKPSRLMTCTETTLRGRLALVCLEEEHR